MFGYWFSSEMIICWVKLLSTACALFSNLKMCLLCLRRQHLLHRRWLGNQVSGICGVMNRWLLTLNYDIRRLTLFEPIFNDIVARRTWKRVCHGEDGEEHENKCKGFGDSEVHWHVSIIETVSRCVRLEVGASVFRFSSWLFSSYCPLSQRCPSHENCL